MTETKVLTNDLLKGLMVDAVCSRTWCQDANLAKAPGVYACGGEVKNTPTGLTMGILIVFGFENANYGPVQIFYSASVTWYLYIRMWWYSWQPWYRISMSPAT